LTVRDILLYPDPVLKQVCVPAQAEEIETVAADLLDTMRSRERCVGIAAPQIGEAVRVAVVDVSEHPKAETSNGLLVLANPRIALAEGSEVAREGCLSLPDVTANVRRATRIVVEHAEGSVECLGFEARAVAHELDHLDGVLFLDRVDSLAEDLFERRSYSDRGGTSPVAARTARGGGRPRNEPSGPRRTG
jgi:peptide deformylase